MGKEYKVNPSNFRRVELDIRLMMPVGTDDLIQWSDDIVNSALLALESMPWPEGKLGKLTKLTESDLFQNFPEKTRDFRIRFYADILIEDK